jgi:hypothetical protein
MWKYFLTLAMIFLSIDACTSQPTPSLTSIPTDTATSLPPPDAHFPQMEILTGGIEMLIRGELALENGCLRVSNTNTSTGDSFLLIWDEKFATRTEQGVVQVIDVQTGEVLASVGDYVEIGGGEAPADIEKYLKQPIPIECPEPNWIVHGTIRKIDPP